MTALHHRLDERLAIVLIAFDRDDVGGHAAVRRVAAPDLLAARPGRLADGALSSRKPRVFLQLVDAVERGNVRGSGEARAHSETVDGCAGANKFGKAVLGQPSACEYAHLAQSASVENAAHAFGECNQVTAVEAHRTDADAARAQARSKCNY